MGEPSNPMRFIEPGPEEDTVLYDQANHRSEHIWKNPVSMEKSNKYDIYLFI
ncbi:hypothetical protein LINPERHAP2_LOCUS29064, partial [Linum perenne]